MTSYRILSAAEDELSAAALYYENAAADVGYRLLEKVQHTIERLCEDPLSGPECQVRNIRKILVPGFPFDLIYTVDNGEILIVSVAHHRRMPGYWSSRIG